MSPRGILVVCLLALSGCAAPGRSAGERFLEQQRASVVLVLDRSRQPLGVGVVSRATYGEVCVALGVPAHRLVARPLLALSDHAVAAEVRPGRGVTVLEARRAGRDLRPAVGGRVPASGATLFVLTATRGPWVDVWAAETQNSDSDQILLGRLRNEARDTPPAADKLTGAPVFAQTGNLVGFVQGVDDAGQFMVGPIDLLAPRVLAAGSRAEGADLLGPNDGERAFEVEVERAEGLPQIDDGWGGADYDLLLEIAGEPQPRLSLPAGQIEVRAPAAGPVLARLVERDQGVFEGVVSEDVAHPARLQALARATKLSFDLLGRLQERYGAEAGGVRPTVELRVEPREPDRASTLDCTALGAQPAPLGRAARGRLDRRGGDATDLWYVELEAASEVWCAILRPPHARLDVSAFGPRLGESVLRWPEDDGTPASLPPPGTGPKLGRLVDRRPLVSIGPRQARQPQAGQRLSVGLAALPAGRSLLRVRSLGPEAVSYGFVVAPRSDPEGLIRALFRLLSREAQRGPGLNDPAFVDQVAGALRLGGLPPEAVLSGLLAELGHRTPAIRRLVLGLLEGHFQPPAHALRRIVFTGRGSRALDAELLLALQQPQTATESLIARGAGDSDPWIRLRTLWIAARIDDAAQRETWLARFADDPAPLVQRALARAGG